MHSRSVYEQVARLHAEALDQGFLSQLGPRFLTLLYEAIDRSPASFLIVAQQGERVTGFVSGGTGLGPVYRLLLRRLPSLGRALLPVLFSPRKMLRIVEILRHSSKAAAGDLPPAELYSIAVASDVRGTGCAASLYNDLRETFARQGISTFKIIVGEVLAPAQAFYRKMGAVPTARISVHGGAPSTVFVDRARAA